MIGFNPGAFVQGYEQGQNRQTKQEQLKMQKQQFEAQQQSQQQMMTLNDLKLQETEHKIDAQNSLIKEQKKVSMYKSIAKAFSDSNRDTSEQALEELNLQTGKPPMKLFSSSDADEREKGLQYLQAKGMATKPYIVEEVDGKKKYRAPNELDPNEMEQARQNAIRDDYTKLNSMSSSGMLIVTPKGDVVGFHDIAALTGLASAMPSEAKRMNEIIAGWYKAPVAAKNPTSASMLDDWIKQQQAQGKTPSTDEIKQYARAVMGKDNSDASGSGYSWQSKFKALAPIYQKMNKGDQLSPSERALVDVLGGSAMVAASGKTEIKDSATSLGNYIIKSKQDNGTYILPDNAKQAELHVRSIDKKLDKDVVNFMDKTNGVNAILDMRDTIDQAVKAGLRMDVVGSAINSLFKMAPDEVDRYLANDKIRSDVNFRLKLKGQEAMIVGQIVKALYGAKASNADRESLEGAYKKSYFDNTATAEMKVKNLLDFVSTAYFREGENLGKRGAIYTPFEDMNSVRKRIGELKPLPKGKPKSFDELKAQYGDKVTPETYNLYLQKNGYTKEQ